jgi:hypothetical protein
MNTPRARVTREPPMSPRERAAHEARMADIRRICDRWCPPEVMPGPDEADDLP